jgi:hypothetical protein
MTFANVQQTVAIESAPLDVKLFQKALRHIGSEMGKRPVRERRLRFPNRAHPLRGPSSGASDHREAV